jgi:hypothetical protein
MGHRARFIAEQSLGDYRDKHCHAGDGAGVINYANSLILCDRLFGTFREGEAEVVGQDERKRLSIRQQFTFPLRPLIAVIRAKRGKSESAVG